MSFQLAVIHIDPVGGPRDAGGTGLEDVAVGEEPAMALVWIPGPPGAPGGDSTPVLNIIRSHLSLIIKNKKMPEK